jgi:aquaporin Z
LSTPSTTQKLSAEALGTFILVFGGCGTAVLAGKEVGFIGVALAFGLTVIAGASKAAVPGFAGLAIGLSLTLIHLVSIPVSNTSVNPARSLGVAWFAGGDALTQVWAFIVAPVVGAAIAGFTHHFIGGREA